MDLPEGFSETVIARGFTGATAMTQNKQTVEEMQVWLVSLLAKQLGMEPASIDAADRWTPCSGLGI